MKFIKQILKHNLYSLCFSDFRLYYTCNLSSHCLSERDNTSENSLNNEPNFIYYFQDGLRKVYPYYHQYLTFCKGRWIGKKIIDHYATNQSLYPKEEILERISDGLIKVNHNVVTSDYVLKNADLISSIVHRHELPVLACPIEILFENDDLLVVDKPPSIPVHSCGLYNRNSVLSILAHEYNRHNLYVIYRLDRLTSGVLLFAKSNEKSSQIHREMNMHKIKKEYICRVEGDFPKDIVVCNKPIKKIYHRIGASIIDTEGKVARTEFQKLSYNGKSSVVLCKPFTGRTHQIRVHLQYLGHPIINDPIYNSFVFGPFKGKSGIIGKPISQLIDDLYKEHSSQWYIEKVSAAEKMLNGKSNFLKFSIFKEYYHMDKKLLNYEKDCSKILKDEKCYYCRNYQDLEQPSLGMFLHAYRYESENWKFESEMPFWASEDWTIA